MQIGNTIKLQSIEKPETVFLVDSVKDYIRCISHLAKILRDGGKVVVKFEEVE